MDEHGHWVLIAGFGSIGRRHFQNVRSLGYADVRLLRSGRASVLETPDGVSLYTELQDALGDNPFAVIVANPTSMHASIATAALAAGSHVLLEKPVSATWSDAANMLAIQRSSSAACSVAYCFRYHPLYRYLKLLVDQGKVGRPFHMRTWQASYLPDWHPWEDYRLGYAASRELGGGVVRTLDHELDMVRWIMGQPSDVIAAADHLSGLSLSGVEDTSDMIFLYEDRRQAHVHVCFGRRDGSRGVEIVGEDATAVLDWSMGEVKVKSGGDVVDTYSLPEPYDLNQMYVDMMRVAFRGFESNPPYSEVPLSEGVSALGMALGALDSARDGVRKAIEG